MNVTVREAEDMGLYICDLCKHYAWGNGVEGPCRCCSSNGPKRDDLVVVTRFQFDLTNMETSEHYREILVVPGETSFEELSSYEGFLCAIGGLENMQIRGKQFDDNCCNGFIDYLPTNETMYFFCRKQ